MKQDRPCYVAFYFDDFFSDPQVEILDNLQVGMYLRLLRHAWYSDPPCSIPGNMYALETICKCKPEDDFETKIVWVLECFDLREDGRYYQKRLEYEYTKAVFAYRRKVEGGLATAIKNKQLSANHSAKHPGNHTAHHALRASDSVSDSLKSITKKQKHKVSRKLGGSGGIVAGFDEFWSAYPRKIKKPVAEKSFQAISPDPALLQHMLATIEWQKTTEDWTREGGRYIPHPATWLNQERWNDEPEKGTETKGLDELQADMLRNHATDRK